MHKAMMRLERLTGWWYLLVTVRAIICGVFLIFIEYATAEGEWWKPYSPPCTERENVFEFTEKPKVRKVAEDRYEITFAVKGYCDVTVAIIDPDPKKELVPGRGIVVRHLGAGVLGPNAPSPFQKNSLKQTIYWDGKDDLGWYVKEPEKLKVRVSLGLKPEFDKCLGGTSPYNIPGRIRGIAICEKGAFVFSMGKRAKLYIRKFDLNGNYVQSLNPPPANLPEEKRQGLGYVEYEPGKYALHGADVYQSVADHMRTPVNSLGYIAAIQPAISGEKLYFCNKAGLVPSYIWYIYIDGGTDIQGLTDRPFISGKRVNLDVPRLAVSPDGKWLYATGPAEREVFPAVFRLSLQERTKPAEVWVGDLSKPGSDEKSLNNPAGIAVDSQGRVYVADTRNNRIQVFAPEGKLIKSIPISHPVEICVHARTGAIYVQHDVRVEGKSKVRTTKLLSLERPEPVANLDGPFGPMALDSWSPQPRLWYSNTAPLSLGLLGETDEVGDNITIWEERGNKFEKIVDFEQRAKEEDKEYYIGRWSGSALGMKVACDPVRETVLVNYCKLFDLRSGRLLHRLPNSDSHNTDVAYDKRGYLHVHHNPHLSQHGGVVRFDPSKPVKGHHFEYGEVVTYPEVPYDYGEEEKDSTGRIVYRGKVITKDQGGAKGFQDGFGVNMRGELAVNSNIYYVPKMDEIASSFVEGTRATIGTGAGGRLPGGYAELLRRFQEAERRGEDVYFIRREPGIYLTAATIWTYRSTGQLWTECAVIAGGYINGVQMDEDGNLYFVLTLSGRTRLINGKPFLEGRAGHYGSEKREGVFTGTLVKSEGQKVRVRWNDAPIKMEELPARPADLGYGDRRGWVEGAAWLYAGASPCIAGSCSCPRQHLGLDWYKRVYLPEQYRHSIGVLDTNGNLIMHIGTYGNFDSGQGHKSRIRVGGDDIAMSAVRFISATDNYLVFDDGGERLAVLKLNYHSEESASISGM